MSFQDVLNRVKAFVSTPPTVKEELMRLQADIAACQHRRNGLTMAPTAREDVEAMLLQRVSDAGLAFEKEFSARLGRFVADARSLENPRLIETLASLVGDDEAPRACIDRALCAALPKQITAAMIASLDHIEWPANPVRLEDRHREIAAIDIRERELQAQEAELLKAVGEAGLNLQVGYWK